MDRFGRIRIITLLAIMLLIAWLTGISSVAAPFEMHTLDVGQGQGVLFECNGHYMMIDGGGRGSSSYVVSYLKQQGIQALDCIAVSHYEEDHMSGIIGVLSAFMCDRLLLPSYKGSGALYNSLAEVAMSNGCEIIHPEAGYEYALGEANVRVIGPQRTDYPSDNDLSLCFRISYGDKSFLICGDAQQTSEADMVDSGEDLSADVYVVNHHGSNTSSTDGFLDAVSPTYAVISCGKDNRYGHPSMETMQRLLNHGVSMFRTDLQGTIVAYVEGSGIGFVPDPCDNWTAGNNVIPLDMTDNGSDESAGLTRQAPRLSSSTTAEETESEFQYVCNINTRKFHDPDCNSVSQMKEANRLYTNLTRDELLEEGYEPCGNCKP